MAEDEKAPETSEEPPKWEYRTNFNIHSKMQEVIHLSLSAAQAEIQVLRRKLEKLQYGS